MPRINFSELDVFSVVDADTDEAKAFLTYLGYVRGIDALICDAWGDLSFDAVVAAMDSSGRLRRMRGRRYVGPEGIVTSLLLNSWLTELHLHTPDTTDAGVIRIANHMASVYAYYATTRSATAWLQVLNNAAPTTHAALLKQMAKLISGSTDLYPEPWGMRCTALYPTPVYAGFASPPGPCSNLARASNPYDIVGMCLRTTRGRQVKEAVNERKRQLRRAKAPRGEKQRCDQSVPPTTVFNFLWRARTRSNYGDPAMFYMGALGDDDVLAYHRALRRITAGTCFVFEALIAQRAPELLINAATHFITRDRSRLSDDVLLPRLSALGFTPPVRRRRGGPGLLSA